MGSLTVPSAGLVYLDANPIIYSVEKHPVYWPLLQPLWQAAKGKTIEIISSDLVLMETLVGPLKSGDTALANSYELLFQQAQTAPYPHHTGYLAGSRGFAGNDEAENARRAACGDGAHGGLCSLCHQ